MGDYRRLVAWQRAYALVLEVYRVTNGFPSAERYGLTSQARRAAVSVAANIAEGAGRGHVGQFLHFLWIARGSLAELGTLLMLARDLGHLRNPDADALAARADEIGRLLMGLLKAKGAVPNGNRPSHDSRLPTHDSSIATAAATSRL